MLKTRKVTAYEGRQGKLFPTLEEAVASLAEEKLEDLLRDILSSYNQEFRGHLAQKLAENRIRVGQAMGFVSEEGTVNG